MGLWDKLTKKSHLDDPILQQKWIEVFFVVSRKIKPSKPDLAVLTRALSSFRKLIVNDQLVGFGIRSIDNARCVDVFLPPGRVKFSDVFGGKISPSYFGCPEPREDLALRVSGVSSSGTPLPSEIPSDQLLRRLGIPVEGLGLYPLLRTFESQTKVDAPFYRVALKTNQPYSPIDLVIDLPVLQMVPLFLAHLSEKTGEERWPNTEDVKGGVELFKDYLVGGYFKACLVAGYFKGTLSAALNYQILSNGVPHLVTLYYPHHSYLWLKALGAEVYSPCLTFMYRVEDRWQLSRKFPKVEKFIFGSSLRDEIKNAKKQTPPSLWLEKVEGLMKGKKSEMLTLRGVRFYYLVKILDPKLVDLWKNDRGSAIGSFKSMLKPALDKARLSEYFEDILISDVDLNAPPGWVGLKISLITPKTTVARSDVVDFYETLLVEFDKSIKSTPKAEFKLYFFEPLTRYWPPESETENIVPVSMLEPVVKKAIEIIKRDLGSIPGFLRHEEASGKEKCPRKRS